MADVIRAVETDAAGLVERWARAICWAGSAQPADIAGALGLDLDGAQRRGYQWDCQPPGGLVAVSLVRSRDTGLIVSAELWLDGSLTVHQLHERLGPSRADAELHSAVPTLVFADVAPPGAGRACAVLVSPTGDWPDRPEVERVTLYLR